MDLNLPSGSGAANTISTTMINIISSLPLPPSGETTNQRSMKSIAPSPVYSITSVTDMAGLIDKGSLQTYLRRHGEEKDG